MKHLLLKLIKKGYFIKFSKFLISEYRKDNNAKDKLQRLFSANCQKVRNYDKFDFKPKINNEKWL